MEGMVDYQTLIAPDGSELVVLSRGDFDSLVAAADEDARDIRAADRAAADPARYPAAVVDAMLDGASPVAAWRRFRGMSQAALAEAAGVSQAGIARLEAPRNGQIGYGRPETREAIARALNVAIEDLEVVAPFKINRNRPTFRDDAVAYRASDGQRTVTVVVPNYIMTARSHESAEAWFDAIDDAIALFAPGGDLDGLEWRLAEHHFSHQRTA